MGAQKPKSRKIRKMGVADYIIYAILILFSLICLYPFWYVFIGSFNEGVDYIKGGIFLVPRVYTCANYAVIFNDSRLWTGFLVSLGRTVLGTVTSVLFTGAVAYAMSRKRLKFRKLIYNINLITMFFGGGAKSAVWKRILANILNMEILSPETEQGPAFGAAILAMVGAEEFKSVEQAKELVKIKERVSPDKELTEKYEAKYQTFRKLYPALKVVC